MTGYRRRRYIISRLQVKLLALIAIYGAVSVLAIGLMTFSPLALKMIDPDASALEQERAGAVFLALDLRLWPAVLVTILGVGIHAVLTTHRIVGPLYRIQQDMRKASRGNYKVRTHIRERDLLHSEADDLNHLLSSVDQRFEKLRTLAAPLRGELVPGDPLSADCKQALESILVELDRIDPRRAEDNAIEAPEPPPALPSASIEISCDSLEGESSEVPPETRQP